MSPLPILIFRVYDLVPFTGFTGSALWWNAVISATINIVTTLHDFGLIMSVEDRVRWDGVFKNLTAQAYPAPDPLLLQFTPPVKPEDGQRALDLCGGQGQNGLWLATQGYAVDIMDISRVALNRARAEMTIRNLRNVNLLQTDVDTLQLEATSYEVICVFRYLKRALFPLIKLATCPGGRIIYQTFNRRYLEVVPGFNPAFLLEVGELQSFFTDWDVLFYEEETHHTHLVALKP